MILENLFFIFLFLEKKLRLDLSRKTLLQNSLGVNKTKTGAVLKKKKKKKRDKDMDCGTPKRVRKGIYESLCKSKAISPSPYNPKTLFLPPLFQIQRARSTSSTFDLISSLLQLQDSTSIHNLTILYNYSRAFEWL